ncbi:hypothetical protein NPX13_g2186 [Xylaria arbuscula]|uniref:Uncharacterized protein n=1 Tax=Xylaria arbuscula TaxID=114810 RepID=A0A9W8NK38_9PEZI|nr:hypothetical protein NPX13_g2186 [Xylaria arbuscula]
MLSKTFTAAIVATFAALIPGTHATWCKYYYDAQCQQDANGDTSFDCANHGSFGSGGGYVQCHTTKTNQQDCIISRCTDSTCSTILDSIQVSPNGGTSPCTGTGGTGPWYEERFA